MLNKESVTETTCPRCLFAIEEMHLWLMATSALLSDYFPKLVKPIREGLVLSAATVYVGIGPQCEENP